MIPKLAKKPKRRPAPKVEYHLFFRALAALGIEKPAQEYRFHKTRRWRFDFCFIDAKLALEVEGGVWSAGRHTRGSGFVGDMEKYNQAAILGYRLLRVTPEQMFDGVAVGVVEEFFNTMKNRNL